MTIVCSYSSHYTSVRIIAPCLSYLAIVLNISITPSFMSFYNGNKNRSICLCDKTLAVACTIFTIVGKFHFLPHCSDHLIITSNRLYTILVISVVVFWHKMEIKMWFRFHSQSITLIAWHLCSSVYYSFRAGSTKLELPDITHWRKRW